ncbi:PadR family transcriptional regulator [Microbacterium sp. JB110]|nr:PadR family transcriptional regulator [Microbacterium sp. JB110]
MLRRRDMYGLELADALVARGLSASEGSLYPLLARMQQAGLVGSRREAEAGGRPRKYYELTDAGRAQLAAFTEVWGLIAPQVAELLEERS